MYGFLIGILLVILYHLVRFIYSRFVKASSQQTKKNRVQTKHKSYKQLEGKLYPYVESGLDNGQRWPGVITQPVSMSIDNHQEERSVSTFIHCCRSFEILSQDKSQILWSNRTSKKGVYISEAQYESNKEFSVSSCPDGMLQQDWNHWVINQFPIRMYNVRLENLTDSLQDYLFPSEYFNK